MSAASSGSAGTAAGKSSSSSSSSGDKFEEASFMKQLVHLRDSQEAINGLSGWILRNRRHCYKISRCWLKVTKRVKSTDQKLVLFYLLNDVVQHAKRKSLSDLLSKCQAAVKEAVPVLRKEEKILEKLRRVVGIWGERQVFDEAFIASLTDSLDSAAARSKEEAVDNFQPAQLCTQLKIMKALEDDTDYRNKTLRENDVDLIDVDKLRQTLKDRQHGNDFIADFEEGVGRMEQYVKALEREVGKRRQVVDLLTQGSKYYEGLLGEATIVATAYTNFGKRIAVLKKKLTEERMPQLQAKRRDLESISPVPSPPELDDVPSPSADDDHMELELPGDEDAADAHSHGNAVIQVNQPAPGIPLPPNPHPSSASSSSNKRQSNGDLSSRLDSMAGSIPGLSSSEADERHGSDRRASTNQRSGGGNSENNYSISEFLTKLARGQDVSVEEYAKANVPPPPSSSSAPPTGEAGGGGGAWWGRSNSQQPGDGSGGGEWPLAHTEWPEPRPDPASVHQGWTGATRGGGAGSGGGGGGGGTPLEDEDGPTPEWQIQPEDEVPAAENDQVYQDNIALARLNRKSAAPPPPVAAVEGGEILVPHHPPPSLISENRSVGNPPPPLSEARSTNTFRPPHPPSRMSHPPPRLPNRMSEDMEISSDDEHHQHQLQQQQMQQQQQQVQQQQQQPPPAEPSPYQQHFQRQEEEERERELQNGGGDGRPTLQDRLRCLAGVPLGQRNNGDGGQNGGDHHQQQQDEIQQQQQQGGWIPVGGGGAPPHPPPPQQPQQQQPHPLMGGSPQQPRPFDPRGGGGATAGFHNRGRFRMRLPGPYPGGRGGVAGMGGGPPGFRGGRPPRGGRGGGRGGGPSW